MERILTKHKNKNQEIDAQSNHFTRDSFPNEDKPIYLSDLKKEL